MIMMISMRRLSLIGALFVSQSVFAQDLFSAKTDFITSEGPISACFGDFNSDRRLDIAVANYKSNTVSIFLNTTAPGARTLSLSPRLDIKTGQHPMSLSVGDFNGDGKPDIAVVNYEANTVSIFLNTTKPGDTIPAFSTKADFPTGERPISISTGDFNGDGKLDIAVANYKSNTISIFLNVTTQGSATPSFRTRVDYATGPRPVSLIIGDLNSDSRPDIAVANYRSNTISVFLNTAVQTDTIVSFSIKTDFSVGERPMSVSIADLRGDGRPALAAANYGSNTVSVLLNTMGQVATTPSFFTKTDFMTGTNPQSLCIADVNGDGKLDLAVANFNAGTISVFLNTTDRGSALPSFSIKKDFITGNGPSSVVSGTLFGHGRPDLCVTNYGSNTISVFLNLTSSQEASPK